LFRSIIKFYTTPRFIAIEACYFLVLDYCTLLPGIVLQSPWILTE
jgi:hypothetical protein